MEVHWKTWLLGGISRKTNIKRGDCLKVGGALTVHWFKGGLARKRGWCFWGRLMGVDTPMHTLNLSGEREGKGKKMKKEKYLPLLLNIMCDILHRM